MKRVTSVLLIVLSLVMIASAFTLGASASSAYQTYTYSIDGFSLSSPDAYERTSYCRMRKVLYDQGRTKAEN